MSKLRKAARPRLVKAANAPRAGAGTVAPAPETTGPAPTRTYPQDVFERWILFLDTLRARADNMIEHERQGLPPLLGFRYETILDARRFEHPANYALLRIIEIGEDCWDDCVDESKPPVIIVDPRAGHGPGIGDIHPTGALRNVAQVSRINEAAYDLFAGPWIRAMSTPACAGALKALHPMRWSRLFNPWMGAVRAMAETTCQDRVPLPDDHPAIRAERETMARIGGQIASLRQAHDRATGQVFKAIYQTQSPGRREATREKVE